MAQPDEGRTVAKSRVIVVDDDKVVVNTVSSVLRHAAYDVSLFYAVLPARNVHAIVSPI